MALIFQDDEGRFGPFIDEVFKWMKQDRIKFGEDVKQKLGETRFIYHLCLFIIVAFQQLIYFGGASLYWYFQCNK